MRPLLTYEIGSLAKPVWRVKAFSGAPLTEEDIGKAEDWGRRLGVDVTELLAILRSKPAGFTDGERQRILRFSTLLAVRMLEKAGLELLWDGEQARIEMYEHPVRRMTGFEFRGHVRSFDNKYYRKASCTGVPRGVLPFHDEELERIRTLTPKPVKVPVTGAYTIVDWSFDEHYAALEPGSPGVRATRLEGRRRFLRDVAGVVSENLVSLARGGARYLQIDEPAATTRRDETSAFVDATLASLEGLGALPARPYVSIHVCFSDYRRLFPEIRRLEGRVQCLHFEYANRDPWEEGAEDARRPGFGALELLRDTNFDAGVGVLNVHTDRIETPALVRDRVLHACRVIGDPARVHATPDCGLRTRTWEVAYEKLCNLVEGRNLAARALGLPP